MGSITDSLENSLLNHLFYQTPAYGHPASVWLGLSTADPTDDGTGWANPTYTGYARKQITFGTGASSRRITATADVTFDPCSGGSSVVTHWGIWTAETSGTLMAHGALSTPKTIVTGNTPSVAMAQIYVEFSAGGVFTPYANSLLDFAFRNIDLAQPTVKVGLSTTIPTDGGPNVTEPGAGAYARVTVAVWDNSTAGATQNTNIITFPTATASWGIVVYAFVVNGDATDYICYLDITDNTVTTDDVVRFAAGALDITLT